MDKYLQLLRKEIRQQTESRISDLDNFHFELITAKRREELAENHVKPFTSSLTLLKIFACILFDYEDNIFLNGQPFDTCDI